MLWLHIYRNPECWGKAAERARVEERSQQVPMLSEDRAGCEPGG